jgi:hypothetical protein
MSWSLRTVRVFACAAAGLAGCALSRQSREPLVPATSTRTPAEAHGLAEFHEAMARYIVLRDRVMLGTLDGTLGDEIRRQRSHSKQGDVFGRDVQPLLRRAVAEELRDPLALDTRHTLGQGNPGTAAGVEQDRDIPRRHIVLVVNDPYPPGRSFSTMPARLLQRLPPLPTAIDYRFVGSALVLVDTRASLVIDYLPNAVAMAR